ncbi:DUF934 domain-containing protein [Gemmobacter caeruleus]|uniref:DUF934 domain-containing protein n=1 Tax=Gemmobacter caeruleus TaxID=2595004 RepID=UPI0011EC36D9|nr:DUF934 domain-containing protein [Gemmobacter caeruleus]
MSVIVTDTGFTPVADSQNPGLDARAGATALDIAHTDDPSVLEGQLDGIALIRVSFPAFNDGRAFTVARRLRMMGYAGELRALGPVIADQYGMARRVGFDSVEIPDALAARQPEEQWKFRADWRAHDYQSRLRA